MTETHGKSRRQSGRIRIIIPIIIVALIGGAFWAWRHYSGSERRMMRRWTIMFMQSTRAWVAP